MGGKSNFGESLDIFGIFELLWKKKWVILLPALSAALIVLLYFNIIPQNKFLILNVDSMDILLLKNKEGKQHFSIRDFNELNKIEDFDLKIMVKKGSKNILQKNQYIDSFKVEKIINSGETKSGIIFEFFSKLEERLFSVFNRDIKLNIMSIKDLSFKKKMFLRELSLNIEIVKKHISTKEEIFLSKDSISTVFLPPTQQLSGYTINMGMVQSSIDELSIKISKITDLLERIDNNKTKNFKGFFQLPEIVNFKEFYYKYEFILDKIDLLVQKYNDEYTIRDNSENLPEFMILAFIFILMLQVFLVLFFRMISEHQ